MKWNHASACIYSMKWQWYMHMLLILLTVFFKIQRGPNACYIWAPFLRTLLYILISISAWTSTWYVYEILASFLAGHFMGTRVSQIKPGWIPDHFLLVIEWLVPLIKSLSSNSPIFTLSCLLWSGPPNHQIAHYTFAEIWNCSKVNEPKLISTEWTQKFNMAGMSEFSWLSHIHSTLWPFDSSRV